MSYFLIFIAVVVLLAVWLIGMYNGFIKLRNKVDEAWGGIQIQLKRRYDLIPNLVETVKGYATHEKETFERLVQARSAALQVPASDIQGQAERGERHAGEQFPDDAGTPGGGAEDGAEPRQAGETAHR